MKYVSTRGEGIEKRSAQAMIQGLAGDKGLYVPTDIPALPALSRKSNGLSYQSTALRVLSLFLDDFKEDELHRAVMGAYDDKFDDPEITPLVSTEKAHFLELFHGRTAAFKDVALSILPFLLTSAIRMENEDRRVVILVATSGDTGKAALEGFADVPGTDIFVFYPKDGVSAIQERQMVTQRGTNTHVVAVRGNFDDAQTAVKRIMSDSGFEKELDGKGFRLSSGNSINFGRLVPQIVYYIHAWMQLRENAANAGNKDSDDIKINIVVPTGNFGNILAAWYAKQIGLPVARFICASNENNVLTDFLNTGKYDANRGFHLTTSPSMDILISSNLERLLWHLSDGDSEEISSYMKSLEKTKKYNVSKNIKDKLSDFYGGSADMISSHGIIKKLWQDEKYLMDTHTAVAYKVYLDYLEKTGDKTPTVIAATASPFKFADKVTEVMGLSKGKDGFESIDILSEATGLVVPEGLTGLKDKKITQTAVAKPDEIAESILSVL